MAGNNIGLPGNDQGNNQQPETESDQESKTIEKAGGLFSGSSLVGMPETFDHSSGAGPTPQPSSSSGMYAQVGRIGPYDPIPLPSQAAQSFATEMRQRYLESYPALVQEFDVRFSAWKRSWSSPANHLESNARVRCDVVEFDNLLEMGTRILPLVVHELLDRHNFTAVFLYNALEENPRYLIDPNDILNWHVLQRQNNLIVEINNGRDW